MNITMLMNVKMPTLVGILTFISMIIRASESLKATNIFILVFMNSLRRICLVGDFIIRIEIIDNCLFFNFVFLGK